ncbi:hypothetical protein ATCC90586_011684 [Pythium insidiosum]|nr:hypothetical protein ATCC90586_011684 [Pythium insidiosum]
MCAHKQISLDSIVQVNLRANLIDQYLGLVNLHIETAESLLPDSDGHKRGSAARLMGVLDAENVRKTILTRRDVMRQRLRQLMATPAHVAVDMVSLSSGTR